MAFNSYNNASIIQGGTNMSGAGDIIHGANVTTSYYLHYEAEPSDTVGFLTNINGWVEEGSIVYIGYGGTDSNGKSDVGKFVPGLPPKTSGQVPEFVMPLMIYGQNSHAMTSRKNTVYDASTAGFDYQYVNVAGGKISGIPMCSGYEFATTEYDKTSGNNYACNAPLTAVALDSSKTDTENAAAAGKIKVGTLGTDQIIGIVSSGIRENQGRNRKTMLTFWGWTFPANVTITAEA